MVHSLYHIGVIKKWYYGFRTWMRQLGILDFDPKNMQICSFEINDCDGIRWENLGEPMGFKMASRIKTFLFAMMLIGVCYLLLFYPLLFSLKTNTKEETSRFVRLTTFEKVLPELIAILLMILNLSFGVYMKKLS